MPFGCFLVFGLQSTLACDRLVVIWRLRQAAAAKEIVLPIDFVCSSKYGEAWIGCRSHCGCKGDPRHDDVADPYSALQKVKSDYVKNMVVYLPQKRNNTSKSVGVSRKR